MMAALLEPYAPAEEELLVHLIFLRMALPLDVARVIMGFVANTRPPYRQKCRSPCNRKYMRHTTCRNGTLFPLAPPF
jgi:hypothetical protein